MNNIYILNDETINKIAAGEVIDRPYSIVKELVENSIDAFSSSITIEIKEGGTSYIRITDNGKGMSKEDAILSFQRHATSKIEHVEDLIKINTLGFRGEALASIAAVTNLEMITREKDSLSGTRIINIGGKIEKIEEYGCPEGTTIIVENLFFNTPARLKFLKSNRAETSAISDLVSRLILSNPKISFRYINNNKTIYYSSGDGELKNAILSIYGKNVFDHIQSFNIQNPDIDGYKIWGYMGTPFISRKTRNHQSFFINGRFVKNKIISKAVELAYDSFLTINQFPWIIMNIDINPEYVDVNVHPAKTEVKFKEEDLIKDFIYNSLYKTLIENPYIPAITSNSVSNKKYSNIIYEDRIHEKTSTQMDISNNYINNEANVTKALEESNDIIDILENQQNEHYYNNMLSKKEEDFKSDKKLDSMILNSNKNIGVLFGTYILVEDQTQCYIIDQHAAHERLLYEKFKRMFEKNEVLTQQVLPPVIIELTHEERVIFEDSMEVFSSLGFEMDYFGGNSYYLRGIPVILGESNINDFFYEVLDNISSYKKASSYKIKIDDIITMSCKKAVKANDTLTDLEINTLISEIKENEIPLTCPHGRPIMIILSKNELERMFKRIQ